MSRTVAPLSGVPRPRFSAALAVVTGIVAVLAAALTGARPTAAQCVGAPDLPCGAERSADTGAGGGLVDAYECLPWDLPGAEHAWRVVPDRSGLVVVQLLPTGFDGAIVVLDAACTPTAAGGCLAAADFAPEGGYEVTLFDASAGSTYYVLVDGPSGGPYRLDVSCGDAPVEVACGNGIDDDGDGRTDCADLDCAPAAGCSAVEVDCGDGVDDDGDGDTDCADPDCAGTLACAPFEEECLDGVDDDGDGDTDCDDSDCDGAPECAGAVCAPEGSLGCGGALTVGTVTAPSGGIDLYGCTALPYTSGESVWMVSPASAALVTVTVSPDLALDAAIVLLESVCAPERCVATRDWFGAGGPETLSFEARAGSTWYVVIDGYDGSTGAFDVAIGCAAPTTELDCANGVDDDGDGAADCEDPDCDGAPGCDPCRDDALEDSDSIATAVAAPDGGTWPDLVLAAGDEDWFRVSVCPGAALRVVAGFRAQDGDLDFALADPDGSILASSSATGGGETFDWTATGGGDVYLLVAAAAGLCVPYDLSITVDRGGCRPQTELDCADGADDDGDGATDCADPDCEGTAACAPVVEPGPDAGGAPDAGAPPDAGGSPDVAGPDAGAGADVGGPDTGGPDGSGGADAGPSSDTGADAPPAPEVAQDTGAPPVDKDTAGPPPDTAGPRPDAVTPPPDDADNADARPGRDVRRGGSGSSSSSCQSAGPAAAGAPGGGWLILLAAAAVIAGLRRAPRRRRATAGAP